MSGSAAADTPVVCRFEIDMALCDGYGVCAELVPELIHLDDWGYPILADRAVPPELARHARRAVRYCPRLALSLVSVDAAVDARLAR